LSENYLKVTLAAHREANRIADVRVGGLSGDGLSEIGTLAVIA
jgi:hypothetical protein